MLEDDEDIIKSQNDEENQPEQLIQSNKSFNHSSEFIVL